MVGQDLVAPVRWMYIGLGMGFVGLGTLGAILPVMPSTVFFILALWAFKRSSPRLEAKLLGHPMIGPTLRDWDENRAIKKRTKIVAITLIWACLGASSLMVTKPFVWVILGTTGVCLTWYLSTRKTAEA